jgi:hypothetical protein
MGFLLKQQQAAGQGSVLGTHGVKGGLGGSKGSEGKVAAPAAGGGSSDGSGGGSTELLEHFGLACGDAQSASEVLNVLLEYGLKLLQIRQNDWKQLADEGDSGKLVGNSDFYFELNTVNQNVNSSNDTYDDISTGVCNDAMEGTRVPSGATGHRALGD